MTEMSELLVRLFMHRSASLLIAEWRSAHQGAPRPGAESARWPAVPAFRALAWPAIILRQRKDDRRGPAPASIRHELKGDGGLAYGRDNWCGRPVPVRCGPWTARACRPGAAAARIPGRGRSRPRRRGYPQLHSPWHQPLTRRLSCVFARILRSPMHTLLSWQLKSRKPV